MSEANLVDTEGIFFVSTRLPDCRGRQMQLTAFRNTSISYGRTTLSHRQEAAWKSQTSLRYTHNAWIKMLTGRINNGNNAGRLLVYVHGFNNNYEDAIERAFKLSRLYYEGVPVVVFSWPSRHRMQSYTYDEDSAAWSQAAFDQMLAELTRISPDITLVAHSMGNRLALNGLRDLDTADAIPGNVRRVVLASPDIDRDEVLRKGGDIEAALKHGRQVLVYASAADRPITLSGGVHGYARLGTVDCRYDVDHDKRIAGKSGPCHLTDRRDGFAIVDTTRVHAQGPLRHADFVDSCPTRQDLRAFLLDDTTVNLREAVEPNEATSYFYIPAGKAESAHLCLEQAKIPVSSARHGKPETISSPLNVAPPPPR